MKILIVDDYSDNRMTIQLLLEEFDDIDASEAEDGQEAIDKFKSGGFKPVSQANVSAHSGIKQGK